MKEMLEKWICSCLCFCKNCPLICIVVGVVMFVLGLILSASLIMALWYIIAILTIAWGVLCMVMKPAECVCGTEGTEEKKDKPE